MAQVHTHEHGPTGGPEDTPADEAAQAARLGDEVALRLARACPAMAPDLLARVVDAVVARRLRWARRAAAERLGGGT